MVTTLIDVDAVFYSINVISCIARAFLSVQELSLFLCVYALLQACDSCNNYFWGSWGFLAKEVKNAVVY